MKQRDWKEIKFEFDLMENVNVWEPCSCFICSGTINLVEDWREFYLGKRRKK